MKATLRFNDGIEIELSEETTNKLRAELVKDDGRLVVDRFRAQKDGKYIRIVLMNSCDAKWDGLSQVAGSNALANRLFNFSEIREIIEGLKRLIGE